MCYKILIEYVMGVFLSSISVAEYEGKYIYVLFDYDQSTMTVMTLFANVDKFR